MNISAIIETEEGEYVDSKLHEDLGYLKKSVESLNQTLRAHMKDEEKTLAGLYKRIYGAYFLVAAVLLGNDISWATTLESIKSFLNVL